MPDDIDTSNNNNQEPANIPSVSLEQEMQKSYLDYAMSVIVSRALPDCRDGLKPVHRRILYSMSESGYNFNKPYKKSARIVGDVMGKYHPHGDSAIYNSMVRMAQDFSMRLELVDGQGNFGSLDGDPPAAMRYTEARLAKVSEKLVEDIDKNTVAFQSNYDDTTKEPSVLPSQFPNLLVNGASGIAVGMATNIAPHNLGEVIDASLYLIKNPECNISDLQKYIFGPDFPSNSPDNNIFLGGEGMIASADGYCDFLRMLTNHGSLNQEQFLSPQTVKEITSPHTQLENDWGYNGYNIWVTSDTLRKLGVGDSGLWQGGGYEGTEFWIDSKRGFVAVKMSQLHPIPKSGHEFYNEFRGEVYRQIFAFEEQYGESIQF